MNLSPVAPCTHAEACPLRTETCARGASLATSWCHFTFAAGQVPGWLEDLANRAGLAKKSLSLSLLLLRAGRSGCRSRGHAFAARIISQGFKAAGMPGQSRYACAACGRCLAPNAANAPSGSLIMANLDPAGGKDAKSGARIIVPAAMSGRSGGEAKKRGGGSGKRRAP